jgi:hypothetical protein
MNIGTIPQHTFPCYGYAINAAGAGKKSYPVSPGHVIYTQLKHISGTPAPEGTQGISINKLRILNTMIEQFSKMKSTPAIDFGNLDGTDEQRINALINHYHKEIRTAQSATIYTPAAPATGALFNITI